MNKYLNIIKDNNKETISYLTQIINETNKVYNIYLDKELFNNALEKALKNYNKKIEVHIQEERYLDKYTVCLVFKYKTEIYLYFKIKRNSEVVCVDFILLDLRKFEVNFSTNMIQFFMNNRMNLYLLTLNNEIEFKIIDTGCKRTYFDKVGITDRFVAYYNKSIAEFSDYLFLNIDFSEEFLNEYLIKHDENIIIEHEKLSKIRIDVRNIIL